MRRRRSAAPPSPPRCRSDDGWSDFPEDPSNFFADLDALIGIDTVRPYYPDGSSLISGQPLVDLVGFGFGVLKNLFGA